MDQLADAVLLEVMQHLSTEDLLGCRLICKRFGALALHPSLWRTRSLDTEGDPELACAVLRLAPCLKSLKVDFPWNGCDHVLWTRCAVERLMLYMDEGESVKDAVLVLQRQEVLGKLTSLVLIAHCEAPMSLYKALAFTSGLKSLSVVFTHAPCYPALFETSCKAMTQATWPSSITDLWYLGNLAHDSFLRFVMTVHAASLETVSLSSWDTLLPGNLPAYLPLLLGLNKLRELSCSPLPGMEALAACETLVSLSLNVRPHEGLATTGAIKLLREATHLRQVTLLHEKHLLNGNEVPYDEARVLGVYANLVLALASSGKSSVKVLRIRNLVGTQEDCRLLDQALLIALPRLPSLRLLHSSHSHQLRGVSPAVAVEALGKLVLGCN